MYHHTPPPASGSSADVAGGVDESYYMHASSHDYEHGFSHDPLRRKRMRRFFPLLACTWSSSSAEDTLYSGQQSSADWVVVLVLYCVWNPVLVLGAIITAVAVTVNASSDDQQSGTGAGSAASNSISGSTSNNSTTAGGSANSNTLAPSTTVGSRNSSRPASCPKILPEDRTVVFWQSEVDGCEKVPVGVTHIVWGFALVADGAVVPTFQNSDAYVQSCVQSLRTYVQLCSWCGIPVLRLRDRH